MMQRSGFAEWFRRPLFSDAATTTGLPAVGFLLAGGSCSSAPFEVSAVTAAAFFSALFGGSLVSSGGFARHLRTGICALTVLLLTSLRAETFCAGLILLLIRAAEVPLREKRLSGSVCVAVRHLLLIALGGTLLPFPGERFLPLSAVCFGAGLFLYIAGLQFIRGTHTVRPAVRPGGGVLFAGAVLCYLVCFFRMGPAPERTVLSWLPVLFSALLSALFLFPAWKAFRTFRRPALPGIVRGWTDVLGGENLLLMESAAVMAAGNGFMAGTLFVLAFGWRAGKVWARNHENG